MNTEPMNEVVVNVAPPPFEWIVRPTAGLGCLKIEGRPYVVQELYDKGELMGYRLVYRDKRGQDVVYDIDTRHWECSCPDCTWRRHVCKHIQNLRDALADDAARRNVTQGSLL